MDKKIIILDSHYRTRTFLKAFEGKNVYLISVNKYERIIAEKNYNLINENILDLSNFKYKKLNKDLLINEIKKLETKLSWKIKDIINSDRRLKKFKYDYALEYLLWIANSYNAFVKSKNITKNDIIFHEPTWSHEILISQISFYNKFKIWSPLKSKLIPHTFYFFQNWRNEYFFEDKNTKQNLNIQHIIKEITEDDTSNKIHDFKLYSKKNTININQIKHFFRLIKESILNNRNKHIHPPIFNEFIRKIFSILKYYKNKYLNQYKSLEEIKNKKIIYFPLHVQPEASIDVIGYQYSNQIEIIKKIAKKISVNKNYVFAIKDHPHCVGNRKNKYFAKIKKLKNVVILSPWLESKKIIKKSELVISIAGTASLEANIMKVPSLVLVKMFFSHLLVKEKFDMLNDDIFMILSNKLNWLDYRNSNKWYKDFTKIINSSFNGDFDDPMNNTKVNEEKNIDKLKFAINKLIKY